MLRDHPGIVGIKEARGDAGRIQSLAELIRADFVYLSGDDGSAHEAMLAGAAGTISVVANLVPEAFRALCDAARSGDIAGPRGNGTAGPADRGLELRAESDPGEGRAGGPGARFCRPAAAAGRIGIRSGIGEAARNARRSGTIGVCRLKQPSQRNPKFMKKTSYALVVPALLLSVLVVSGCGAFRSTKDWERAQQEAPLEIPPGLDTPSTSAAPGHS